MSRIISNKIQCNNCKDIIVSRSRHEYVSCHCGECAVDGGTSYLRRSFKTKDSYTELSLNDDVDFEIVRNTMTRGGRGKDGRQPLKYVLLKDMSNEWLKNTIQYNIDNGMNESNKYYILELEYRKNNDIYIED